MKPPKNQQQNVTSSSILTRGNILLLDFLFHVLMCQFCLVCENLNYIVTCFDTSVHHYPSILEVITAAISLQTN